MRAAPLRRFVQSAVPERTYQRNVRRYHAVRGALGPPRCLPDFLGIGCIKGGSTSLWHVVSQHDQVMPASEKQIRYFDYFAYLGPAWYRSHFPTRAARDARARELGRAVVTGEVSPSYLSHPLAPARAGALVPHARLVALVRNPIDRAYSHWQHSVRAGRDPETDFDRALDLEAGRLAGESERVLTDPMYFPHALGNFSYQLRGHYAEQLERWFEHFPRAQVLVVRSEDFAADPARVLADEIEPHLGIAASVHAVTFERQRVGGYREPMRPATRDRLREHFAPHNAALEALLGRRFDWD